MNTRRIDSPEYRADYAKGWAASVRVGRTGGSSSVFESGRASNAWEDGYYDQAAGREKWHLLHCTSHDETCG